MAERGSQTIRRSTSSDCLNQEDLVWIFGSPRSGSTWLLAMLSEHDRTVALDEPLIGMHLGPFTADRPGSPPENIEIADSTLGGVAAKVPTYFFSQRYADVWAPALKNLILSRFSVHADPGRLLIVKEPNGTQAADLLLRALPDSRVLFLLRDGRDVVDSELAAYAKGSWMSRRYPTIRGLEGSDRFDFVRAAAHRWTWRTNILQEVLTAHSGPKILVRYEDLLSETNTQLGRVLEWLGLSAVGLEDVVKRHSFAEASSGPAEFVRAARPGLWQENLSADEQGLLEEIMGETLRKFGYSSCAAEISPQTVS